MNFLQKYEESSIFLFFFLVFIMFLTASWMPSGTASKLLCRCRMLGSDFFFAATAFKLHNVAVGHTKGMFNLAKPNLGLPNPSWVSKFYTEHKMVLCFMGFILKTQVMFFNP
jgi:hypothetical protein